MSVRDLEEAMPAVLAIRSAEPRGVDWEYIRREIGLALPADFVMLSEAYPPFSVDDFLGLLIPSPGEEKYFVAGMRSLLDTLVDLAKADMSHGYVPFPEPGGLIPWGSSCEGDVLYWYTAGGDSDSWTVVVSGRNDDWFHYHGDLTSYLAAKARGTVPPDGLPSDFPSATPLVEAD